MPKNLSLKSKIILYNNTLYYTSNVNSFLKININFNQNIRKTNKNLQESNCIFQYYHSNGNHRKSTIKERTGIISRVWSIEIWMIDDVIAYDASKKMHLLFYFSTCENLQSCLLGEYYCELPIKGI